MATPIQDLSGRKIAVVAADGFEMVEFTLPVNAFRLAGADIKVISLRKGRIRGVNLHEPAHRVGVDLTIDEARSQDFDGIFFPGGFINPDILRQSRPVREFIKAFDEAQKPIATLCHGPWLLSSAGLLRGRTVTSWPGIRDDLVNAGAIWLDQAVVQDRNWITSRGPHDLHRFIPAVIGLFRKGAPQIPYKAGQTVDPIESAPAHDHPPQIMLEAMRWAPRPSLRGLVLGAAIGGFAFGLGRKAS